MSQILDQYGRPVERKPEPHRFGHFIVPDDARVTFRNVRAESAYSGDNVVAAERKEPETR